MIKSTSPSTILRSIAFTMIRLWYISAMAGISANGRIAFLRMMAQHGQGPAAQSSISMRNREMGISRITRDRITLFAIGKDGKTLHIGFIWAQQDYEPPEKPPVNPRYGELDRFHRYNLYYAKVDLSHGYCHQFRRQKTLTRRYANPSRMPTAWCGILKGRISPMGPSIYLDENDTPYFLLAVSDETPYQSTFYFLKNNNGAWRKTPITKTPHPFNNGHLERNSDGSFSAYMIAGAGESISHVSKQDMGRYGWGDRVEWWMSDAEGENWRLTRDLTPAPGKKWQNVKFVSDGKGETIPGVLLFYGWEEIEGPGTAYLWDNRNHR